IQSSVQLGGGDLSVRAGNDIDGGAYYVERGRGVLQAGGTIHTNSSRASLAQRQLGTFPSVGANPNAWLPTTLFLGNGSFAVRAAGDVLLGAIANPFLLPQSQANDTNEGALAYRKTYFSTYATSDAVNVSSLNGDITLKDHSDSSAASAGG